jgi:prepilin-type N-terminal cleavage/methylation domain-containing protein
MRKHQDNIMNMGFTLVELLVSLALFSIVMLAAVGTLYTVNSASQRVTAMRAVLDNLDFAMESMSRTIRTGENIVCGDVQTQESGTNNCPFGTSTAGSEALYLTSTIDGSSIEYRWRQDATTGNNEIQKCTLINNNGSLQLDPTKCVSITDPNINVQKFSFYVNGADPSDGMQPSVIIMMQGVAAAGPGDTEPFDIQTYISQRAGE